MNVVGLSLAIINAFSAGLMVGEGNHILAAFNGLMALLTAQALSSE